MPTDEAVWVTGELILRPRDIYDITKIAAEQLCRTIAFSTGMSTLCLRVSRFFAQTPDLQSLHWLYRDVDLRDAAAAHVLALTKPGIAFDIMNISARSPFLKSGLPMLLRYTPVVLQKRVSHAVEVFAEQEWKQPTTIDRVYVIEKAERLLGYHPVYGFEEFIQQWDSQM